MGRTLWLTDLSLWTHREDLSSSFLPAKPNAYKTMVTEAETAESFEFCNSYNVFIYKYIHLIMVITVIGNDWLNVQNSAAVDGLKLNHAVTVNSLDCHLSYSCSTCVFCLNQKSIWWLEVFPSTTVLHPTFMCNIKKVQQWFIFGKREASLCQPQTSKWLWRCLDYVWENCEHASKIRINILSSNLPSLKC